MAADSRDDPGEDPGGGTVSPGFVGAYHAAVSRARLGLGLAAVVVALSRVLLLPDGPWEQDEAIFAAAVLDYDIVHHRPQPPGFPGWIALGKVAHVIVGDPLLALRLLSCVASVATFVLLAVLLRRVVPPVVALAAATLHAFTPTVWFHAPRAFADTPAVGLALGAIAAWTSARPRVVGVGWVLLAWATLVRPQLLPVFAVLAIVGVIELRRASKLRASHLALATLVGVVVVAVMIADTGSLARLLDSMGHHFDANERASTRLPDLQDLGIVRGLGGVVPGAAWATATLAGLVTLARRDRRLAVSALALLATTLVVLLAWHSPAHPRYQPPLVAVAIPLVAVVAARLGPRVGAAALALVAAANAWQSWPALAAAHAQPLPLVAALRDASTREGADTLVLTHGSVPFARLARMTGDLSLALVETDDTEALAGIARPFLTLTPTAPLPGVTIVDTPHDDFPAAAWDLSQRRFDHAHVIDRAVLLSDGVYRIEHDGEGEPFAWLSPTATLLAQPGADALALVLVVSRELAPLQLQARVGDADAVVMTLAGGLQVVRIPTTCPTACRVELAFGDRIAAETDARELSARLYGAWCEGEDFPVPAHAWSPGKRLHAAAHGVVLEGAYNPEIFGKGERPGAWTNGKLRAEFPAGPGTLAITLANPSPREPKVVLRTDAEERAVEVTSKMSTHEIAVTGANGRAFLEIEGDTRVPAEVDPAKSDERVLGQVLIEVRFTPSE